MKTCAHIKTFYFIVFLVNVSLLIGCKTDSKNQSKPLTTINEATSNSTIIEVITQNMEFNVPTKIPSGWTTFEYKNNSSEVHFFVLEKLPEGITIEEYKNELIPPFRDAYTLMNEGKITDGLKEFDKIPAWYSDVIFSGGVGLLSPHHSGTTTIYLSPGKYAMECYVRMSNGIPHVVYGMLEEITVTDTKNKNEEPTADFNISISTQQGITMDNSIAPGTYTFGVHYIDQKTYENFVGHDVNLVKVEAEADINQVISWINSGDFKAFRSPAPEGFTFMGGVQEMGLVLLDILQQHLIWEVIYLFQKPPI